LRGASTCVLLSSLATSWRSTVPIRLRRPPTSPLFPYTTLFRSRVTSSNEPAFVVEEPICGAAFVSATCVADALSDVFPWAEAMEDRKSTRLNSSHEWISYAVFCLKKEDLATAAAGALHGKRIGS